MMYVLKQTTVFEIRYFNYEVLDQAVKHIDAFMLTALGMGWNNTVKFSLQILG